MQVTDIFQWRQLCMDREIIEGSVIHDDNGRQYIKLYYEPSGFIDAGEILATDNGRILNPVQMRFPVGVSLPEDF